MKRIASRKDRKTGIGHNGNIPDVSDSGLGTLRVDRDGFSVHSGKETVAFKNLRTYRRENALRENHHRIMMDARPSLMISHSGLRKLGSGIEDLERGGSKFGSDVITAMNGYRVAFKLVSEKLSGNGRGTTPIPRNKSYIGGEVVASHKI